MGISEKKLERKFKRKMEYEEEDSGFSSES